MQSILRNWRMMLAILLFVFYVAYQFYSRHQAAKELLEQTLENAIQNVAIVRPKPGKPTESIVLPGKIDAWYEAPIYAQVSGYVKMWYKDYGAQVKKGDILAQINAPALDAEYRQAIADVEAERARYGLAAITADRYVALRKSHAVSEQSISVQQANEKAQAAELNAAIQNVKNFEAKIKFKTIIAPYDGIVTERNINVGDYINTEGNISNRKTNTNLFSVADIHKMRLFLAVPGTFAYILNPKLSADVTVPQFPHRHFKANFLTVANGFDPNSRTVITEFTIDNPDKSLWPGSYATVRVTVPNITSILTIPTTSLVYAGDDTQIATISDDNHVHFKPITISKILDGTVEVAEGINESDRIVDNPVATMLEGDEVRIQRPAPGYDLPAHEEF